VGQLTAQWFNSPPPGADWTSRIADFDVLGWTGLVIVPGIGPRYLGRTDRSYRRKCVTYQYDKASWGSGNQ